jgi:hypothetical protein
MSRRLWDAEFRGKVTNHPGDFAAYLSDGLAVENWG